MAVPRNVTNTGDRPVLATVAGPHTVRQRESGRERAIVMGGSVAGLMAARVLSDHYREVIVVERDIFGPTGEQRRGVPQGGHTHSLLASGLSALEGFFPGFTQEAVHRGALLIDRTRDAHSCFAKGEHIRFESGLDGLLLSRPFLEGLIRERVRRLTNVKFREGCQVTGLLFTSEGRRVTGIRTSAGLFAADLIIDATGRGSRSPSWLEAIGNGRPPEDKIEMNMAYCTRCFRRSPHHLEGASLATIPATPEHGKGGIVLAQEGDSWIVTLVAYCGGTVPTELPDYIEFAKGLPFPYIHDVISQAEPIGEAHAARISSSIRRRYERMKRFPQGYLVLGDAVCSFNPAYGQGMSVAALEACALGETLRRGSANLARRFYARIANIVDIPWSLAAGGDLRMSQVIGSRTPILRFRNWYIAKLHLAARQDSRLVLAFQRVVNLLAPPSSLLRPSVMVRVLFAVPVQVAVRQITELFLRGSLFRSLGKVRSLIHFFW